MIVERMAAVAAKPSTIWKNFSSMDWDKWDPDVKAVEDVQGGMQDGSSLVFVMKDNDMKIKTTLSDVVENERFTFSGGMFGGIVGFKGTFELVPEGDDKTNVTYTFGMSGCGGALMSMLNKKAVVGGTEGGLENVKKFSEQMEKSQ